MDAACAAWSAGIPAGLRASAHSFALLSFRELKTNEHGPTLVQRMRLNAILIDMKSKVFIESSIFDYSTYRYRRNVADAARHLLALAWWEQESSNFELFTLAPAEGERGAAPDV